MNLTEGQKEQLDVCAEIVGIRREGFLQAIIESSLKELYVMDRIDFLVSEVNIKDRFGMYKTILRQQKDGFLFGAQLKLLVIFVGQAKASKMSCLKSYVRG